MYKMIIVDDESRIRRGLRNAINWEELGISIAGEAANGKEGINLVVELHPDLIITDIKMPDIDGLAFIKTIRDMGIHAIIIIISGYDDFSFAQQAIRFGVTDYILKPVNEDHLYERISECMKKFEIAKEFKNNHIQQGNIPSRDNKGNMLIDKAIEYLNMYYYKDISLNDVANQVFIHPNYFSSLFSEVTGDNYSKFLAKLRISKAKELMKNPQLKVYEISEMVGYSDYRRFSKLFKFYEGASPVDYRKTIFHNT